MFDAEDFKANIENSPFFVGAMTPIASKVRPSDPTNIHSQSMQKELIALLHPSPNQLVFKEIDESLIDFSLADISMNQTLNRMDMAFI